MTPHTRPPTDDDGDHMLVRTVECIEGSVELDLICEPAFDYGRTPAEWTFVDGNRHMADASGGGQTIRLVSDLLLGIDGNRVRGRHTLAAGREGLLRTFLGRAAERAAATSRRRTRGSAATTRFWRDWLGRARIPDHRFREPDAALGTGDQGSDLHADRRDRGSPDDLAARNAGW